MQEVSMIDKQHAEKISEWFGYAEKFMSRDIVIHAKVNEPHINVGYSQNKDSPKPLPVNRVVGSTVFFDNIPQSEFYPYKGLVERANNEPMLKNKAMLGGNIYDETLSSKLGGRGIRVGGVNQNDYLITLTFHLIPTDDEYLNLFQSRQTMAGGVEEAIINYWNERYGEMTESELDHRIKELLAKNDAVVDRVGLKAKYHELMKRTFK